jgi:hypothetical protein
MVCTGVTQEDRDTMWKSKIDQGSVCIANSVLDWVREEISQSPASQPFFNTFMIVLDEVLQQGSLLTTGRASVHDMLKFTGDIIVTVSANAFFGKVLLQQSTEILDSFPAFDHHAWEIMFQPPKFFFKTAHNVMGSVIGGLTRYFELPQSKRRDAAAVVLRAENVMRQNGIESRDIAALIFKLFWG